MRLLPGVVVLAVLVSVVGTEPFVTAARSVRPGPLAGAAFLALLTTVAAAWRWHLVAGGLGVEISPARAVAAYYRSQLLNLTLPGGVLGDVHRGVRHGRRHRAVNRALRAVVWERAAGQAVQLVVTVAALLLVPSPLRPVGGWLVIVLAGVLVVGVVVALLAGASGVRGTRLGAVVRDDVRTGLLAPGICGGVVLASLVVVAGHVATFWLAARVVGVDQDLATLVVVGLCVLGGAALPANLAGWGPREGTAAWVFTVIGADPAQGVAVSAVYGMMALVAVLPGALVLAATRSSRPVAASGPAASRPEAPAEAVSLRG